MDNQDASEFANSRMNKTNGNDESITDLISKIAETGTIIHIDYQPWQQFFQFFYKGIQRRNSDKTLIYKINQRKSHTISQKRKRYDLKNFCLPTQKSTSGTKSEESCI